MTNKRKLTLELKKLWKQKCLEAYGNKCLLCKTPGVFHHYIMKSRNGLYKFDIKNGIPLCNRHHYLIHHASPPEIARIVEQIRFNKGELWCKWADLAETKRGESFRTIKWLEEQKLILQEGSK